jgi:hypothetical protein
LALLLWTTAWLLLTPALASTAALARALAPPVRSLLNNLVQSAAQKMRNEERAFREARSFCVHFCVFAHNEIMQPSENASFFLAFSRIIHKILRITKKALHKNSQRSKMQTDSRFRLLPIRYKLHTNLRRYFLWKPQ